MSAADNLSATEPSSKLVEKYIVTNGVRLVSMALSLRSAIDRAIAAQGNDETPCHVAIWKIGSSSAAADLVCYLNPSGTVVMASF